MALTELSLCLPHEIRRFAELLPHFRAQERDKLRQLVEPIFQRAGAFLHSSLTLTQLSKFRTLLRLHHILAIQRVELGQALMRLGEILTEFPSEESVLRTVEPVYEEHSGWMAPTSRAETEADLPAKARQYLARLEELIGVPFCLISTGAGRHETIVADASPLLRWFPSVRSTLA